VRFDARVGPHPVELEDHALPDRARRFERPAGKNLMDHTMGGGARGMIPGMEDRTTHGNRPKRDLRPRGSAM